MTSPCSVQGVLSAQQSPWVSGRVKETKWGPKSKLGEVFFNPPLSREALWALLMRGKQKPHCARG